MSNQNKVDLVWATGYRCEGVLEKHIEEVIKEAARMTPLCKDRPTIVWLKTGNESVHKDHADCQACVDLEAFENQAQTWQYNPSNDPLDGIEKEPEPKAEPKKQTLHDIMMDKNIDLCVTAQVYANTFAKKNGGDHMDHVRTFIDSYHRMYP